MTALFDLPPNSIAHCTVSPKGCPIACGALIMRLSTGAFEPALTSLPTLAPSHVQQADFEVLAQGLTEADIALMRRVGKDWHDKDGQQEGRTYYGPQYVARTIGALREAEREQARLSLTLAEIVAATETP